MLAVMDTFSFYLPSPLGKLPSKQSELVATKEPTSPCRARRRSLLPPRRKSNPKCKTWKPPDREEIDAEIIKVICRFIFHSKLRCIDAPSSGLRTRSKSPMKLLALQYKTKMMMQHTIDNRYTEYSESRRRKYNRMCSFLEETSEIVPSAKRNSPTNNPRRKGSSV